MQIQFVRSGGFAGAATGVSGTIQLDESGGRVTADDAGYRRELAPSEAEQLRKGADPAALSSALPGAAAPGPVRDGYQYDFSVTTRDGETHKFTYGGTTGADDLKKTAPDAAQLLSWVEQETQKIWAQKVRNRTK